MASDDNSFINSIKRFFVIVFIIFLATLIGSYLIANWFVFGSLQPQNFAQTIADPSFRNTFLIAFLLSGMLLLVFAFGSENSWISFGKGSGGATVKARGGISKYYDTNWLTIDELRKDPAYKFHYYEDLSSSDNIGVPIRAEFAKGKLQVNMYKAIHTIVIGTTGAGKTTQFVDPTVQILGETNARPCMVITDPKGEIYDQHSQKLRKRGYRIVCLDLKEPFKSTCWNPMTRAFDINERAMNLNREVVVHRGEDPRDFKLKCVSQIYYNEWYEFDGYAFADVPTLQSHQASVKQILKTEAFEDLKDIAATLCPIQSNNDPIWERGAKDLVLGTMLAMLEDSEIPELGMTREKYNFYNLSKILNLKDNDAYNPLRSITEYFQGRDPLSLAVQLANQVVTNAEKTTKSYMGIVTDRMGIFSDTGVCYATSTNEMELTTFADQPTALFIKIPDEKTTRHPIATMFISQLYKILVDVANKRGGALPRDVYFLLDEFGNMPKIENFETIITVARSRRIYFTLILQSYAQLEIKYGKDVSATVKDNCNIHIFIASNDQGTLEEFSKRCGNISVETETTSSSKDKSGKSDSGSTTTNVQLDTRPLIYPDELRAFKPGGGQCIVSILQRNPIKSVFTPSYLCKAYDMERAPENNELPKTLKEQELYYDIRIRNQKVLQNSGQDGGGAPSGFDV